MSLHLLENTWWNLSRVSPLLRVLSLVMVLPKALLLLVLIVSLSRLEILLSFRPTRLRALIMVLREECLPFSVRVCLGLP